MTRFASGSVLRESVSGMRKTAPMIVAKTGYIVISAALCVLGVLFIVNPASTVSMIGRVTGIAFCVFGVIKRLGYLSKDLFRLAFQYDLAFGILVLALGVISLIHPGNAMTFACIALGICVLADGLFKIQIAIDAKAFGITVWWMILIVAIFSGTVGTILVFRPTESAEALTTLMGISLLGDGILNLTTVLSSVRIVRHQRPDDVIDANGFEIR